jgi:hypothetical protein
VTHDAAAQEGADSLAEMKALLQKDRADTAAAADALSAPARDPATSLAAVEVRRHSKFAYNAKRTIWWPRGWQASRAAPAAEAEAQAALFAAFEAKGSQFEAAAAGITGIIGSDEESEESEKDEVLPLPGPKVTRVRPSAWSFTTDPETSRSILKPPEPTTNAVWVRLKPS